MRQGATKKKSWRSEARALINKVCPEMMQSMMQSYDGYLTEGIDEQRIYEYIVDFVNDYKTIHPQT